MKEIKNEASCNCTQLISYLCDAQAVAILERLDAGKYSTYFPDRDRILERLFRVCSNADFDAVYLKCTVLNDFYSTRILSDELAKIAKQIVKNHVKIDAELSSGEDDAVETIRSFGDRRNYSFATKYANWHNHLDFPIYDSFVCELLCCLRQCAMRDLFDKKEDLKDYACFRKVLQEVVSHFNLTFCKDSNGKDGINYKLLDKFLWALSNFVVISKPEVSFSFEKYKIKKYKNGSVRVFKSGKLVENTKETLIEIAKTVNLTNKDTWKTWNTRQLGKEILKHLESIQK